MKSKINIYCDGSCLGNPGPGGWAALLISKSSNKTYKKLLVGSENNSTNNRMELKAVIEGLLALKKSYQVNLYSDSKYVIIGMKQWIFTWRKNGFKTTNNKPVKNKTLWIILNKVANKHNIIWHWIKAHSGIKENEQVDKAAKNAAEQLKINFI